MNITIEQAERVLAILNYSDFNVVDIYEDSFRAIRDTDWCLSELNLTFMAKPEDVTVSNYHYYTNYVIHVLKRHYKEFDPDGNVILYD